MTYQEQHVITDEPPALHAPTNEELNRVAAEICGWVPIPEEEDGWTNGKQKRWPRPPDFCTDRNALPELWNALIKKGNYISELRRLLQIRSDDFTELFRLHSAEPRLCVIAALKSLGAWRTEWTSE